MTELVRVPPPWLDVSRETLARLDAYCGLVEKWNPAINLIAKPSLAQIWDRHVLDSAQVLLMAPEHVQKWGDLGSGAGFPGLVVAILAKEFRPDLEVVLVESDRRKSVFLAEVARQLDLRASVRPDRIEATGPLGADVISARALARLAALCSFAQRHLKSGGTAIFLKGASVDEEVAEARQTWSFDLEKRPSRTDDAATTVILRNIARA